MTTPGLHFSGEASWDDGGRIAHENVGQGCAPRGRMGAGGFHLLGKVLGITEEGSPMKWHYQSVIPGEGQGMRSREGRRLVMVT